LVVDNCEVSGEGGIDSVEAKRSPLSPGFPLKRGDSKKTWRQQRSKERSGFGTSAEEYCINEVL